MRVTCAYVILKIDDVGAESSFTFMAPLADASRAEALEWGRKHG
jgi:hypothetical protein